MVAAAVVEAVIAILVRFKAEPAAGPKVVMMVAVVIVDVLMIMLVWRGGDGGGNGSSGADIGSAALVVTVGAIAVVRLTPWWLAMTVLPGCFSKQVPNTMVKAGHPAN